MSAAGAAERLRIAIRQKRFAAVGDAPSKLVIENLRLEHARRLLLETENSVLAVAFECGFENASNFHRAFKAAFGCSPSVFRQRGS